MTYGFRVTDVSTQVSTYIDDVEDILRLVDRGINGSVEALDDGGNVLARFERVEVGPDNPRELAETFCDTASGILVGSEAASAKYTTGDCDVFAVALSRLIEDGTIVGIVDPNGDDGEEIVDAPPRLVHAGLLVGGDYVLDVQGLHDRTDWEDRWCRRGSIDCELEYLDQASLESMQGQGMSAEQINEALPIARLVAISNGYETAPEPAAVLSA